MDAPKRDFAADRRAGLCSYCGEPAYKGNAFIEFFVLRFDRMCWPTPIAIGEGWKFVGLFSHAECGPSNPYVIPFRSAVDVDSLHGLVDHVREKGWPEEACITVRDAEKINASFEVVKHHHGLLDRVPDCPGIYFARSDDFVKIGKASNIRDRLRTLQTSHPKPLALVRHEHVSDDRARTKREKELHRRFAHLVTLGEWFRYEAALKEFCEQP